MSALRVAIGRWLEGCLAEARRRRTPSLGAIVGDLPHLPEELALDAPDPGLTPEQVRANYNARVQRRLDPTRRGHVTIEHRGRVS